MLPIILHDKAEIRLFLQKDVFLHIYSLGDLDDFFWSYTTWYALRQDGDIRAIILQYIGQELPVLLMLSDDIPAMSALIRAAAHLFPRRFYSHLSPGLEEIVGEGFTLEPHGAHHKMALNRPGLLRGVDVSATVQLSTADLPAIEQLYAAGYPGNWFDARMLETGQYFGLKTEEQILSIAGIHVYSKQVGVAALGNIVTHPAHRRRGLGQAVTARLCLSLEQDVDYIGLNVKADNRRAIAVYEKLGFEIVHTYGEYMVEARP